MESPRTAQRSDYAVRALGVVLSSAVLHVGLSHLLLGLLCNNHALPGQRGAVSLVVVATGLASLGFLYLRTQYSSPDHVARSLPAVLAITPLGASALFLPVALQGHNLINEDVAAGAAVAGPVVVATWTSGLLLALVTDRLMRALAVRHPPASLVGAMQTFAPPTMAHSHARLLGLACGCATLVCVGSLLSTGDALHRLPALTLAGIAGGLIALLGLAIAAGVSLGQAAGEDFVSIARRLDALGYNPRQTMASPVVVTSYDEAGSLLWRLEALRARLEEELQTYQEALDKTKAADFRKAEFLNAVSHELRTPLNAVSGFAQLLLEGIPSPVTKAQAEDVRLILAGGDQLLDLINDILDISMIESGELRLSFAPTELGAVLRDVARIHQPLVRDREVDLTAELGPNLPVVVCDRRRIIQILTNLVSNAIKFTEEGSITLRGAYDPHQEVVVIRCIDSGVGIAADELEAIFEEYRQAGPVAKRRKKGVGLGLAIARSIAQHHGGSLSVESTPGAGSTFSLTLPLDPPARPGSIDMARETAVSIVRAQQRSTTEVPVADQEAS